MSSDLITNLVSQEVAWVHQGLGEWQRIPLEETGLKQLKEFFIYVDLKVGGFTVLLA